MQFTAHSRSIPTLGSHNDMLTLACQDAPRPASQQRPSFSFGPASLPRNSYTRPHTYSASPNSINPVHRITRRKSSTLSPAAINAAVNAVEADGEDGGRTINRRSVQSRVTLGSLNSGSYPSPPNSLPQNGQFSKGSIRENSALVDGPSLSSMSDKVNKNRLRRASDGSTLSSSKKKGGNGDLKCETCGKAYKHSSCLTKHLLVPLYSREIIF